MGTPSEPCSQVTLKPSGWDTYPSLSSLSQNKAACWPGAQGRKGDRVGAGDHLPRHGQHQPVLTCADGPRCGVGVGGNCYRRTRRAQALPAQLWLLTAQLRARRSLGGERGPPGPLDQPGRKMPAEGTPTQLRMGEDGVAVDPRPQPGSISILSPYVISNDLGVAILAFITGHLKSFLEEAELK